MSKKFIQLLSPPGEAVWPKLSKPETKFNPEGVYETKLRLDAVEGGKFNQVLEEHHADWLQKCSEERGRSVKAAPLPVTKTEEDGVETGEYEFKFKLNAVAGKEGNKWEQRPALFDSKGKPIDPDTVQVGSGSKITISFEVAPYFVPALGAGLSLRMKAVQVIDLVEFGGNTFDSFGFQQQEGYAAEVTEGTTVDDTEDNSDF